jgi:LmbE family N-acetylglucosaminyl deacetylase
VSPTAFVTDGQAGGFLIPRIEMAAIRRESKPRRLLNEPALLFRPYDARRWRTCNSGTVSAVIREVALASSSNVPRTRYAPDSTYGSLNHIATGEATMRGLSRRSQPPTFAGRAHNSTTGPSTKCG